ncbi:hypothetical protein OH76DRAFT_1480055 [Lentinus brumalis]|uniref:Uncharacterized protein n=1 Tax=Lentinus brumalis TaxID=2498619 RepID=A0A371DKF0_9APHY|nr:hypothetical protein OH76DRAFT_1480055 [Polyporus brumalis]
MDSDMEHDAPESMHIENMTLAQLQREAPHMSNDMIERCLDLLVQTAANVREIANAREPLCAVPVEVLHRILEAIPVPLYYRDGSIDTFQPFWHSATRDSARLIPLTQTCRHLRRVALSDPLLWSTVITHPSLAFRSYAWRNDSAPLAVVMTPFDGFTDILDAFYPSHAHRVRELHFTDMVHGRIDHLRSLMKFSSPGLRSYTFCGENSFGRDLLKMSLRWPGHSLPLPSGSTATLRDIHIQRIPLLPSSPLPQLTHLALCEIYMRGLHIAIANVLSLCPSLESLVLSSLFDIDNASIQDPQPLYMKELHRLTMPTQLLIDADPTTPLVSQWLSLEAFQPATSIAFTRTELYNHDWMSFTRVSSDHVAHVSREFFSRGFDRSGTFRGSPRWYAKLMPPGESLLDVREVWVANSVSKERDVEFAFLQPTIASLPALETLVLRDHSHGGGRSERDSIFPGLSMCPSMLDPSFQSHRLKTLRLIYGLRPSRHRSHTSPKWRLSFKTMLTQLKTGAYDYLEHLVVQMGPQLVVRETDLVQLRAHFTTVQLENVDEDLPEMPLPSYCDDPRAGPHGSQGWVGSIWPW